MSEQFNIGVVGANGAIGKAIIEILEERNFPIGKFTAIDVDISDDAMVLYKNKSIAVKEAKDVDWTSLNIAFFCHTDEVALKFAPLAADAGVAVIDSSNAFNQRTEIPMVIPHINGSAIGDFRNANIITSPAASVVQLWTVLKPIYDNVGISRINLMSHHSVSSAGDLGIKELARQCGTLLNGMSVEDNPFSSQLAFNILPIVGVELENGTTDIEETVNTQTTKLLGDDSVMINSTAVMTPVFYGMGQSVNVEMSQAVDPDQVRQWFDEVEQIEIDGAHTPTQIDDASGTDFVHVGRLRADNSHPHGINLWSVSDNIRTSSALNCVKIAEMLIRDFY
jgi:aspartate-semialdehyde dehydrogenase